MEALRIGTFELHPSERMLCADSKPIELGGRAFDLLLALAEQPGKLVTKSVLLERVWPRLVVDENNLPTQVAALRRVLGADAIRTVQGFGYRLELKVCALAANPAAVVIDTAIALEPPKRLQVPKRNRTNRSGPMIGREDELAAVMRCLQRSNLVSVVGVAGVGKTRLAREVLERVADREQKAAAWVALNALEDVTLVPSAIAVALGLSLPERIDGFDALAQLLETEPVLLVFDCAERLAEALAAPLSQLIEQTQHLRILITSQAPLGIAGELVYRLPVLPVPRFGASVEEVMHSAAVTLFAQRATAADQRFALTAANATLVGEICRRLDGIPLALELAAARVPGLGIAELRARLDDRLRLLKQPTKAHEARHDTLNAAFDWSYGLLGAQEQRAFDALGSFAASFGLPAALECLTSADVDRDQALDLLSRLVSRSLVSASATEPPRYALLETGRLYALSRQHSTGDRARASERMAAATLLVLDSAYDDYWSMDENQWRQRFEPEIDNVRVALIWAIANDGELSVALFGSAWPLFAEVDLETEARGYYDAILPHLTLPLTPQRVARFWEAIATYDVARQWDRSRYAFEISARKYLEAANSRGRYYALTQLATNRRADTSAARSAFQEARQLQEAAWPSRLLSYGALAEAELLVGEEAYEQARRAYERAVRTSMITSERLALSATVRVVELDIVSGSPSGALVLGQPLSVSLQHQGRHDAQLELLALIVSAQLLLDDVAAAAITASQLYEWAMKYDPSALYMALDAMTLLACRQGRLQVAARIVAYSDKAHEKHGQSRRRPVEALMRTHALQCLHGQCALDVDGPALTEASACAWALGLSA